MYIKFILLFFCVTKIFANNTTSNEYYYPFDDNGELMLRNLFTKLNTIIVENQSIKKSLMDINRRPYERSNSKDSFSGWTVIQRRQDGSINFNRLWSEYKKGFGNPNGEFFIGLEKLHAMTSNGAQQELWFVLQDFNNETRYAIYDKFVVGDETEKYSLKELGLYRGTAGDYFSYHKGNIFSTQEESSCAQRFEGGWWYKVGDYEHCYHSNLNGPYLKGTNPTGGIAWGGFHAWNYSLKFVEMLIRSV